MTDVSDTEKITGTWVDGRTVWKKDVCVVVASGMSYLTCTFTGPRLIDAILDVKTVSSSPKTTSNGVDMITLSGLVVGFTLVNAAISTTLCYQVIVEGE